MNISFKTSVGAESRPMTSGEIRLTRLAFAVIGLAFLAFGAYGIITFFHRQATWIDYPTKVLSADMTSRQDSDNDTLYKVVVEYQYEHPEKKEIMTGVFGDNYETSSYAEAKGMLAKYAPGASISVKMNPKDPTETGVFLPMSLMIFYILAFMGAVFVLVAQVMKKAVLSGSNSVSGSDADMLSDSGNVPEGETIHDFEREDGTRVIRKTVRKTITTDRDQFAVGHDQAGKIIQAFKEGRNLSDIDPRFSDSSSNDKLYKE